MAKSKFVQVLKDRLARQSTWSTLAIQFGALAVLFPAHATVLAGAAAICGIVKPFVPEDSAETREAVCKVNCDLDDAEGRNNE